MLVVELVVDVVLVVEEVVDVVLDDEVEVDELDVEVQVSAVST